MHDASTKDQSVIRILFITFFFNGVVCLLKLIYGFMTHSISLEADGFHSLLDASSNIVALVGIKLAIKPPDEGHPYGHRKIEALASLGIAILLFITCFEIISQVVGRTKNPVLPQVTWLSFFIMGITMAVNFYVSTFEKKWGERLKSDLLIADAFHTRSDLFVSLSVIASLIAVLLHAPFLDGIIASGIVIFIIYVASRVLSSSVAILLDAQLIPPEKIEKVVKPIPGIVRCHKIRSRGTRSGIFVDLHIHVDPMLSTEMSHRLTHQVINTIKSTYPEVIEVLIHTEPAYSTEPATWDKTNTTNPG